MKTNQPALCHKLGISVVCLLVAATFWTAPNATAQTFTTLKHFGVVVTNVTGIRPLGPLTAGPDGTLYGTASEGEGTVVGTVFKIQPDGSGFTVLKWFTNDSLGLTAPPGVPQGRLAVSGNIVYGTTPYGGAAAGWSFGTVFKLNTDGTGFAVLKYFSGTNGANPYSGVVASSGMLYGVTRSGGESNRGTIFRLDSDGNNFTVLRHFVGTNGSGPYDLEILENTLYGTTVQGGGGYGTAFKMNTDGSGYTLLRSFIGSDGEWPHALTVGNGAIYGTTWTGGNSNQGTVFRLNTDGSSFQVLHHFSFANDGVWSPGAGVLIYGDMLYGMTHWGGASNYGAIFCLSTNGTGFSVIKDFTGSDGAYPSAALIVSGGVLFGTTKEGGIDGLGTVFRINPDGTGHVVLKELTLTAGPIALDPRSGLICSANVLYGTTSGGGMAGSGSVFRMNTDGSGFEVIKHFLLGEGSPADAELTLSGQTLYGVTWNGGTADAVTVFKLNTNGSGFSVLKEFTQADGENPASTLLVSGDTIYGATSNGGTNGYGTIVKLRTDGSEFSVLHQFTQAGGHGCYSLVLSDGMLYGTAYHGGQEDYGTLFRLSTNGTDFTVLKHASLIITPDDGFNFSDLTLSGQMLYGFASSGGQFGEGTLFKMHTNGTGFTVLKQFLGTDAQSPFHGLTVSGNTLYGTTPDGGLSDYGTVFRINTDGTGFKVLRNLAYYEDGAPPTGMAFSQGVLYGTAIGGGAFDRGTVFKLDLSIPLTIGSAGTSVVLNWHDPWFTLQSAPSPAGIYTNIPGATSPHTNAIAGPQQFFRLIGN